MSNLTATTINNANKGALRQLCRNNGVSYANLDVSGMRAALLLLVEPDTNVHAGSANYPGAESAPEVPEVSEVHTPRVFTPEEAPLVPVSVTEPVSAPALPVARLTSKGVRIQKDRPEQNGVRMPSAGTACRAVWDWCQAQTDAGTPATAASVKAHANASGWNVNNASIEFYNWRKFNGVSGRSK